MPDQKKAMRACRQCYGGGKCFHCSGAGLDMQHPSRWGEDCRSCRGTGRCVLCQGRGEVAYATDEFAFPSHPATHQR